MRDFDYSFLSHYRFSSQHLGAIDKIITARTLLPIWKQKHERILSFLEPMERMKAVRGMSMLSGFSVSESRIAKLAKMEEAPENATEIELMAYMKTASEFITMNDFQLSVDMLIRINKGLLAGTGYEGGVYRFSDGTVKESPQHKNTHLFFVPPRHDEIDEMLHKLVDAYNAALRNPDINPLLLIPCFIIDFLCVSPFMYGTLKTGMIAGIALLNASGYGFFRYSSLEAELASDANGLWRASATLRHHGGGGQTATSHSSPSSSRTSPKSLTTCLFAS